MKSVNLGTESSSAREANIITVIALITTTIIIVIRYIRMGGNFWSGIKYSTISLLAGMEICLLIFSEQSHYNNNFILKLKKVSIYECYFQDRS